eukprot:12345168-Prorocentrum_lima.AAC.1
MGVCVCVSRTPFGSSWPGLALGVARYLMSALDSAKELLAVVVVGGNRQQIAAVAATLLRVLHPS